jgi:DNA-binding transcriptional ArsR family regulator/uncharacterized protein YndB with AHSA1/START domain
MSTAAPPRVRRSQDGVFRALAHPVRRRILDLLRARPRTTGGIAERFEGLSRYGVMKHLAVLEEAGLVVVVRRGRERWNHLNPVPVAALHRRFVSKFAGRAADRLLALRRSLEGGGPVAEEAEERYRVVEIVAEIRTAAPPGRAWEAITSGIGGWWPAGFFSSEKAKRMVLEPRIGGRVYEDWGRGDASGLQWYTVIGIDPGRALRLQGFLTPEWGGPSVISTCWTVDPDGDGARVRLAETVSGRASEETVRKMTGGWKTLLEKHLRPFLEDGGAARRDPG